MDQNSEIDPKFVEYLQRLQPVGKRDEQRMAQGRALFLQEAGQFPAPGVSQRQNMRHTGWKATLQFLLTNKRKEQSHMFGVLTTLIVILGMVFGGGGVTVAAAQSSTPDQALYPVKIWSEDARASLTADPETQVDLALQFASRRAEEIKAMAETGEAVPEAVFLRLQNQIERALQIAADQPEGSGERLLLKTRDRLHQQDQLMQQLTPQTGPEAEACLQQARQMIQERLNWAEDGLADPARLQEHLRLRNGTQNAAPGNAQDDPSRGRENAPGQSEEPGNPWTDESPTPGSGYGLGPGPDANCTPGSAPGMMKTPQPASPGNNPGSGGNGNGGGGKP